MTTVRRCHVLDDVIVLRILSKRTDRDTTSVKAVSDVEGNREHERTENHDRSSLPRTYLCSLRVEISTAFAWVKVPRRTGLPRDAVVTIVDDRVGQRYMITSVDIPAIRFPGGACRSRDCADVEVVKDHVLAGVYLEKASQDGRCHFRAK